MGQQGERAGGADWWGRLYDEDAPDTGRTPARDSVDERFDSAARTVGLFRREAGDSGAAGAPEAADSAPEAAAPEVPAPRAPAPVTGSAPAAPAAALVPDFVGDRPPTYESEPTALPAADPEELAEAAAGTVLVPGAAPDTVLDGARYGCFTLRAVSLRGDSARYRGEPRRDALLTARFGSGRHALVLVAVAGGSPTAGEAHRAAREVCRWIGAYVGRSHTRLSEDIRSARRDELKSGLHRLTGRGYGRLAARAAELDLDAAEYTADVRCLLLPADPGCRTRVFFGTGGGGLFRLRDGAWQDIEPDAREEDGGAADTGDMPAPVEGFPASGAPATAMPGPFRFRTSVARPGDTLLLCSAGLAEPMRGERAFADRLAGRWAGAEPPGLAGFLADAQLRVKGYADDRTAAAVWEH
ncbi:hypothetical protein CUT44_31720 [Streptomyces carminius]|uniref:PPM-type phosphatase domain-containing protein n=1 Tax=Streptomyces carminius TaxID=2665496 RepID=A0A2M8LP94_9ACTN|nr:protein phosphatase 2C domain-containing protein [Streptomyces carminius]PJE93778.1 hypothetical protein CUT44_31720 [Streptomyces carminius]